MAYEVKIIESTKELTPIEEYRYKRIDCAVSLDAVTEEGPVTIDYATYAVLNVHNDKSIDNPDYRKFVICDKSGQLYQSGSESLETSVREIVETLGGVDGWVMEVSRQPSKNRVGSYFLTANVVEI